MKKAGIDQLRKEGIAFMQEQNYSSAIERFDKALGLRKKEKPDSLSIDILAYRAEAEYRIQDYDAAYFTYSILYDNDDKAEYLVMMIICKSKSEADIYAAFELYEKLQEKKDRGINFLDGLYELSDKALSVYLDNKDNAIIDKLLSYSLEAKKYTKEKEAGIYTLLSNIYYYSEDYNKALEYIDISDEKLKLKEDIELSKVNLSNKASCYEYLQDFKKAYDLFNLYIELYGENAAVEHEISFLKSRIDK